MKLALVAVVLAGCMPFGRADTIQTVYTPVPASAPFPERYAQFAAMRKWHMARDYRGLSLSHGMYSDSYLVLANGQQVRNLDELLPLVAPDTEFARAIHDKHVLRARKRRVWWIGGGMVAASVVLFGLGALALSADHTALAAPPLALATAGLFGGLGYWVFAMPRGNDRKFDDRALDAYDASLASTLRICVQGTQVIDCAAR